MISEHPDPAEGWNFATDKAKVTPPVKQEKNSRENLERAESIRRATAAARYPRRKIAR